MRLQLSAASFSVRAVLSGEPLDEAALIGVLDRFTDLNAFEWFNRH
jgi:hypothetical protein